MNRIILAKFEPIRNDPAPDTIIEITSKVPDFDDLAKAEEWYQSQAGQLVEALFHSLPQGVFDRLWIEIMRKKMSLYRGKTDS